LTQDQSTTAQHLTFRVGGAHLALAIDSVREVTRMPRISRVPHAPPALLGLANFRGTVIPVLSASALQGGEKGETSRLIVIDTGELLGLAVDDASHVGSDAAQTATLIDGAEWVARSMPERTIERRTHEATTALLADDASDHANTALVIFAVGDQEFALPATATEFVAPLPADIALMPDSDDAVVGSGTFGDTVVPLLSLRALLALPRTEIAARPRVVVAHIGSDRVGLVVDAMRGIVQVAHDLIDPIPHALRRGQAEARIQAICRLDQGERLVSLLAADHLLRDDITADILTQAQPEREATAAAADTEQFLIFQIGAEEFGIPIGAVDEVAPLPAKLARLPNAPAFVLGVMTLRGTLIPVIDQGQRFGADASSDSRRRVIVVRIGELQAAFAVDAIAQVVRIDTAQVRPPPDLGSAETRLFDRVANLAGEQRIVLIIDPRMLLDRAEQDLLLGLARKGRAQRGARA